MKVTKLGLEGLSLVQLDVHGDKRGFFVERFNVDRFREHGLVTNFAQINHSRSAPGVLRGLHYQYAPAQSKLVGCVRGRILDVAVDIRLDSPTFGKYHAEELSDENGRLLYIPGGFAHGLCVLGDEPADVMYFVNTVYNPSTESGILWNDSKIGISWPLKTPTISARDQTLPSLKQYSETKTPWKFI